MEFLLLGVGGLLVAAVAAYRRAASRSTVPDSPRPVGIRFRDLPPDRPRAVRPTPFPVIPPRQTWPPRDPKPASPLPPVADLTGLRDALSGAPLDGATELYRCTCEAFYLADSLRVIRARNGGRCVCCASTSIVAVRGGGGPPPAAGFSPTPKARAASEPEIVTLANYRGMAGRVVTFEGRVPRVIVSRSGRGIAVMFEDTTWTRGLKLVAFPRAVARLGGLDVLRALEGRTVRVRGLLQRHPKFGYQIVVHDPAMILSVR